MYENLTRLIDAMEIDTYGEMVVDKKSKGTIDDPIHMPCTRDKPCDCTATYRKARC